MLTHAAINTFVKRLDYEPQERGSTPWKGVSITLFPKEDKHGGSL